MSLETVASLIDFLRRHRFLEPEQLDALTRQPPGPTTDPKAWARDLLHRAWLAPYQVNQLFRAGGANLVLGSYVLLEHLGEGGMGTVFKAKHQHLGRVVALKLMRKEWLAHRAAVQRFQREIRAAALLDHPNVV